MILLGCSGVNVYKISCSALKNRASSSLKRSLERLEISKHKYTIDIEMQSLWLNTSWPCSPSFSSNKLSSFRASINNRSTGVCRATQLGHVLPAVSPDTVVVREAKLEDWWEVAETHCTSFFPNYSFPLDIVLRVDRLVAMLSGFSVPIGCSRTCLVAVIGAQDFKIGACNVAGILTLDTVADFLPRKGKLRQRRKGIAYVSNVAVREGYRRRGIAKRLVADAEAQARSWGCRSITLHCDASNHVGTQLYKSQGFRCVKVPEGANWPQPKTSPDMQFHFMMKLLRTPQQQMG